MEQGAIFKRAFTLTCIAVLVVAALVCSVVPRDQACAVPSATTTSVQIGKQTFKMKLAPGKPAKAFRKYLSKARTFRMQELNGNEKYRFFTARTFPTNEKRVQKVQVGDVMLYGDDCLVIFYKSHTTSYAYTKIGRITATKGLVRAAGSGSVRVKFGRMKQAVS